MTFEFVDEHRHIRPVRTICAVLGLSQWLLCVAPTAGEQAQHREPRASGRHPPNLCREWRVLWCAAYLCGAAGCRPADRTTPYRPPDAACRPARAGGDPAPRSHDRQPTRRPDRTNSLRRNFTATAPNQVWLVDLTYIRTGDGWLFLAALIDMHTRKVVGWSMRETLHGSIALEALDMAIRRQRPAPGFAVAHRA